MKAAISFGLKERRTRAVEAGLFASDSPGLHSRAGRIGRGANPPPQFGQTFRRTLSTQAAQKVHSYEQIRASVAFGGRSLSQYSQFGLSSSATPASRRQSHSQV